MSDPSSWFIDFHHASCKRQHGYLFKHPGLLLQRPLPLLPCSHLLSCLPTKSKSIGYLCLCLPLSLPGSSFFRFAPDPFETCDNLSPLTSHTKTSLLSHPHVTMWFISSPWLPQAFILNPHPQKFTTMDSCPSAVPPCLWASWLRYETSRYCELNKVSLP